MNNDLIPPDEKISEIDVFQKKTNRKNIIKIAIYLMILSMIGILSYLYMIFFDNENYYFAKQSIGVLFTMGFFVLLSYFILKQKIYKHNFLSLIIIAFTLLIIFIISVFYIDSEYIFYSIIYYFFYSFVFCLYDILGKKYMNDLYETPYLMMLVIGIVDSLLLIIYDIFAYNFNRDISGIIIGFQNNITSVGEFFAFVLDIILTFIWNLGIWLTVYYFSPCHFFISEYISEYIIYLADIRKYKSESNFY